MPDEIAIERQRRLSEAEQWPIAQDIFDVIRRERDKARRKNEETPEINDGSIERDFRFQAGVIWMANRILNLPQRAAEKLRDVK